MLSKTKINEMNLSIHYSNAIMGAIASQITSHTIVCSTVYAGADQRKHQSSASLSLVRVTHPWPLNSPHKWPVTRKMFPFDDVIMCKTTLFSINIQIWILRIRTIYEITLFIVKPHYFLSIHKYESKPHNIPRIMHSFHILCILLWFDTGGF